ncbi:unnamed protein product [Paramecium sonneborni]|uniref:Uncharacterized protein n=1 Tax=Paramecium sonneborni TaxID=65129 RepID=A0A8S1RTM4_9CILI|nr:unnamed protein product [Paramecium sonneborni]
MVDHQVLMHKIRNIRDFFLYSIPCPINYKICQPIDNQEIDYINWQFSSESFVEIDGNLSFKDLQTLQFINQLIVVVKVTLNYKQISTQLNDYSWIHDNGKVNKKNNYLRASFQNQDIIFAYSTFIIICPNNIFVRVIKRQDRVSGWIHNLRFYSLGLLQDQQENRWKLDFFC